MISTSTARRFRVVCSSNTSAAFCQSSQSPSQSVLHDMDMYATPVSQSVLHDMTLYATPRAVASQSCGFYNWRHQLSRPPLRRFMQQPHGTTDKRQYKTNLYQIANTTNRKRHSRCGNTMSIFWWAAAPGYAQNELFVPVIALLCLS